MKKQRTFYSGRTGSDIGFLLPRAATRGDSARSQSPMRARLRARGCGAAGRTENLRRRSPAAFPARVGPPDRGICPEFTKTGCILLTGLVKTNQYPEKQAVQAESLHGLTEIILVFFVSVVKRKDEKHRKRRSAGKPAAGHDLSGEERKTDPFSRAERTGTRLRCSRSR